MSSGATLGDWLFRPFRYIAGTQALFIGLGAILATAAVGHFSGMHNDGVIDAHMGQGNFLLIAAEGLINWLVLSLFLLAAGKLASRSHFRILDLLGTQAMARWPMFLVAFTGFLFPIDAMNDWVGEVLTRPDEIPEFATKDLAMFIVAGLVSLLALIWMVTLMWQGFKISTNVKGPVGVIGFVVALIAAEVLAKWLIFVLINSIQL